MQEWFNWHAWNACRGAIPSGVRIPASPPSKKANQLVGFSIHATVGRMQHEIEIKALLGSQEATDKILEKVRKLDPNCTVTSEQKQ